MSKMWLVVASLAAGMAQAEPASFDRDVAPILAARCSACHSAKAHSGGLSIESEQEVLRGGQSGPAVIPGRPSESLLLTMVMGGSMPKGGPKLAPAQLETIRRWIESSGGQASTAANALVRPAPVSAREVLMPVLGAKCFACHGRRIQEGGLDLRTRAAMLKGGKSGPAIVPGKPDESLLVQKIVTHQMPPPKLQEQFSVRDLDSGELDKLKQWIADGAPADTEKPQPVDPANDPLVTKDMHRFWSFESPVKPAVPQVRAANRVRNPVDAFLLQKLEAKSLGFSPEAGKAALLRRAYLDLTGLPPSPADIDSFLADQRPDAYERLIDRLLDSPHYGERWARYWLDAAGYSDSEGAVSADSIRPHAWRYRDYVIRSLNADKPYRQFLIEQIAGDELFDYKAAARYTPQQVDNLVATGFLRMAPDSTYSTEQNFMPERFDVIANEIEVLSSSVMGLTIGCARCHNHKFDPIPQRDYFRLGAILQTAYDPYDWRVPLRDVLGVGAKPDDARTRLLPLKVDTEKEETDRWNAPIQDRIAKLEAELKAQAKPYQERLLAERLASLPENVREDVRAAILAEPGNRTQVQQYLITKFQAGIKTDEKAAEARFEEFKSVANGIRKQIQAEKELLRPSPQVRALFDMGGEPTPNYLLHRGDVRTPGALVEPGPPSVLSVGLQPYVVRKPPFETDTSGRRLAFAEWLTQPGHPLTARVMVNRIWQHHFGHGLVASPANYGHTGRAPSHPELLDWLATEFVRQGWSMKAMHRLIMTSAAYRQSSRASQELLEGDPDNSLLSRFPVQRLDADALRDSILQISGRLNPKFFGPPAAITERSDGEVVPKSADEGQRRSIYLLQRRTKHVTFLDTFDTPQLNPNCLQRSNSTVSSQALEMFNSDLLRESARYLAGRIMDEQEGRPAQQIEQAYILILARPPQPGELRTAETMLADATEVWRKQMEQQAISEPKSARARWMALAALCHTLLNSAEFLYVD